MTEYVADGAAQLDRRLADAIERLGHGMRSLAQRSARAQGLTPLQQQVVLALARQPAVRREVNTLAAAFDVSTPTMSEAVGTLERKHLLLRSPRADGRRRLLTLTDAGEAVAVELASWNEPLLSALANLPMDDRVTTLHSLLRLIADLQRRGVIGVARTCTTCRFFTRDAHADPVAPHRCELLRAPLPLRELRTDCAEHELAAAGTGLG